VPRWNPTALELGASHNIVRRNVFVNNGSGQYMESWGKKAHCLNNRIYHNTYHANHRNHRTDGTADEVSGNIAKNNTYTDGVEFDIWYRASHDKRNLWAHCNVYGGAMNRFRKKSSADILQIQNTYPTEWLHTLAVDPRFVNAEQRDFRLRHDSPLIDRGAFLTRTTGAGQGSTLPVEDAMYFSGGWGIVQGDMIQLEGGRQTARIVKIDYDKHALTLDRPLQWRKGQGISLPYNGTAPDIGAFEFR